MKTFLTLFIIFSIFYFASSCKKGEGTAPPIDSTHYNDSVAHVNDSIIHVTDSLKHIADSIAHIADSVYKTPYGVYFGSVYIDYHLGGNSDSYLRSATYSVVKSAGDSISIGPVINGIFYRTTFLENSQGHYHLLTGSGSYTTLYEATVGLGNLEVHERYEDGGPSEYDDSHFYGMKKK